MKKILTTNKSTKRKRSPWINILIFIVLFGVLGGALILITKAASPAVTIEPEDATIAANAVKVTDGTASGGEAVQFKKPVNSGDCLASDPNLKFCDEFNGAANSAIDSTKWKIMSGASSWGVECFVNSPNNIAIDGAGSLKMTVRKESSCNGSRSYSSGGVETAGKYYFQYGRVEIRAKAACGGGLWSALWTSTGNNGPSWPNSGEIDILEIMDGDPYNAQQTLHGGPSHWQLNNSNKSSTQWCQAFHVYGVDWRQGSIKFMVDGVVKHTETPSNVPNGQTWPFDSYNQRVLLDQQIGNYGGTINDNDLPTSMLIDYIRIYK